MKAIKDYKKATSDYIDMIKESWTYNRMDDQEKTDIMDLLTNGEARGIVKGDYMTRNRILNAIYSAYLKGIGYEPIGWRE